MNYLNVASLGTVICGLLCSSAYAGDPDPKLSLVVEVPTYQAFLTNIGHSSISMRAYSITSVSESMNYDGWAPLANVSDQELIDAFGPDAPGFVSLTLPGNALDVSEANLGSGLAVFEPGQSWSIGFPFASNAPNFVADAVFEYVDALTNQVNGPVAYVQVPEPMNGALLLSAMSAVGIALRLRKR